MHKRSVIFMVFFVFLILTGLNWRYSDQVRLSTSDGPKIIEFKFDETLEVRQVGEELCSMRGYSLQAWKKVMEKHKIRNVDSLIKGIAAKRMDELKRKAWARSGKTAPDLLSWYQIIVPEEINIESVLNDLKTLPEVVYAYVAPEPVEPPQILTPDFTWRQGYFRSAPGGIDADYSRNISLARGQNVLIVDLEYDWNFYHEDLQLDPSIDIGYPDFARYPSYGDDHGTAVLGILRALDNSYGVTGGVPECRIRVISPTVLTQTGYYSYRPAWAMLHAIQYMTPGDILLIEQQASGPPGYSSYYAPLEYIPSVFDATKLMTQLGIVVVATAGNGYWNLDNPIFEGLFDRSIRDSGAIFVGAGHDSTHERLSYSNSGSRLDLQGWGRNVTSTGYGGLYGRNLGKNYYYTSTFSGTSSAGPIVTTAVAAVQSFIKNSGYLVWSGKHIADLLKRTGTPQGPNTAQTYPIGPLPNLRAAFNELEKGPIKVPVEVTRVLNTKSKGLIPVVVMGSVDFDVRNIDLSTVRLGNEKSADIAPAERKNGTVYAVFEDTNGDGIDDLVLHFDIEAMVENEEITMETTSLSLNAFLKTGEWIHGRSQVIVVH